MHYTVNPYEKGARMAEEAHNLELPMFISVDDHVVEPHGLWEDRLPARYRQAGPRVERLRGQVVYSPLGQPGFETGDGAGDRLV